MNSMTVEIWATVPRLPGFEVSNRGGAVRVRKGVRVPVRGPRDGTRPVAVRSRPHKARVGLHRLIAEAFIGPPPFPGALVRHLDDDPSNNDVSNLAWGGKRENAEDAYRNGLMPVGEERASAKLSVEKIQRAVELRLAGVPFTHIGPILGVSESIIREVLQGRRWQRRLKQAGVRIDPAVAGVKREWAKGEANILAKLTEAQARDVITRCRRGERSVDIASLYGVHTDTVGLIRRRKTWRHLHETMEAEECRRTSSSSTPAAAAGSAAPPAPTRSAAASSSATGAWS
jgi:hypothetical protein